MSAKCQALTGCCGSASSTAVGAPGGAAICRSTRWCNANAGANVDIGFIVLKADQSIGMWLQKSETVSRWTHGWQDGWHVRNMDMDTWVAFHTHGWQAMDTCVARWLACHAHGCHAAMYRTQWMSDFRFSSCIEIRCRELRPQQKHRSVVFGNNCFICSLTVSTADGACYGVRWCNVATSGKPHIHNTYTHNPNITQTHNPADAVYFTEKNKPCDLTGMYIIWPKYTFRKQMMSDIDIAKYAATELGSDYRKAVCLSACLSPESKPKCWSEKPND